MTRRSSYQVITGLLADDGDIKYQVGTESEVISVMVGEEKIPHICWSGNKGILNSSAMPLLMPFKALALTVIALALSAVANHRLQTMLHVGK
jgi:hypothetical protein